ELGMADEESGMLRLDLIVRIAEVERHLVRDLDAEERAEGSRLRQAEELGQEIRGFALVAHVDDGVVQLHGHGGRVKEIGRNRGQTPTKKNRKSGSDPNF